MYQVHTFAYNGWVETHIHVIHVFGVVIHSLCMAYIYADSSVGNTWPEAFRLGYMHVHVYALISSIKTASHERLHDFVKPPFNTPNSHLPKIEDQLPGETTFVKHKGGHQNIAGTSCTVQVHVHNHSH